MWSCSRLGKQKEEMGYYSYSCDGNVRQANLVDGKHILIESEMQFPLQNERIPEVQPVVKGCHKFHV